MAETGLKGSIDIPKVGKVKKTYVYVAVGGTAAYVGWKWYNARAAGATADTAYTTGDVTDSDIAASGVVGAGGVSGNTQYAGTTTDGTTDTVIGTNAQWTQQAVSLLSNAGMDPVAVYAALGDYLAQRGLTVDEQSIVRSALAAAGNPPVGGPYVITEQVGDSTLTAPTGLTATTVNTTSVILTFTPVTGAASYSAYRGDLGATVVGTGYGSTITVAGLQPNKTYTFTVAARTATGKAGPSSASLSVKTKAVSLAKPSTPTVSSIGTTSATVTTKPVAGADGYLWYINGVAHGHSDAPTYPVSALRTKTSYQVSVAADNTTQAPGPQSARATFKTK